MDIEHIVIAVMGLVGTITAAWLALRGNKHQASSTERTAGISAAIDAYDRLSQDLETRLEQNSAEILRLQARLIELDKQYIAERKLWTKEQADLRAKILALQAENADLKKQLRRLQQVGN